MDKKKQETAIVAKEDLLAAFDRRIKSLCDYMSKISEDDEYYDTTLDSLLKLTKARNDVLRFEEDVAIQVQTLEIERAVKSKELEMKERELNLKEAEIISNNENSKRERIVKLVIAGVSFLGILFEGGVKIFGLTTGYNADLKQIYPSSSTFNDAKRELYSPFRNKIK